MEQHRFCRKCERKTKWIWGKCQVCAVIEADKHPTAEVIEIWRESDGSDSIECNVEL